MKALQRPDLLGWSGFDHARNVDFNGVARARPEGTVLFDPMPWAVTTWPAGERDTLDLACDAWLGDGDSQVRAHRRGACSGGSSAGGR